MAVAGVPPAVRDLLEFNRREFDAETSDRALGQLERKMEDFFSKDDENELRSKRGIVQPMKRFTVKVR